MKPHKERVVVEQKALTDKLAELEAFIDDDGGTFNQLPKPEQDRLRLQAIHMK